MTRWRLVTLLLIATACSHDGPHADAATARIRLAGMIDGTATAVADGLTVSAHKQSEPEACTNSLGKDTGRSRINDSVEITIPHEIDTGALIERARRFWDREGYKVEPLSDPKAPTPAIHANQGDYGVIVDVREDQQRVRVAGSSPCVKDGAANPEPARHGADPATRPYVEPLQAASLSYDIVLSYSGGAYPHP